MKQKIQTAKYKHLYEVWYNFYFSSSMEIQDTLIERNLAKASALAQNFLLPSCPNADIQPLILEDFACVADKVSEACQAIIPLLSNPTEVTVSSRTAKKCVPLLLICGEHSGTKLWTSEQSQAFSQQILNLICNLFACINPQELFANHPELSKLAFDALRPKLLKETWKQNPGAIQAYSWLLYLHQFPHVSELLAFVLPTALILVDDFEDESRIQGLQCLTHIIHQTTPNELRYYNQSEVIWDVLVKLTCLHEVRLLENVYPPLFSILKVNCPHPEQQTQVTPYDTVMDRLLSDLYLAQSVELKTLLLVNLQQIIPAMQITSVRWLPKILPVIDASLETPSDPKGVIHIETFRVLKVLLMWAQPRIQRCEEEIFRSILLCVYDLVCHEQWTPQIESSLADLTKSWKQQAETFLPHLGDQLRDFLTTSEHNPILGKLQEIFQAVSLI